MSGIVLPTAVSGTATGWELTDYVTQRAESPQASGGLTVIELRPLDDDTRWLIDHAIVYCDSTTPTAAYWYENDTRPINLLDGTSTGNFDVGDWPVGLQLAPGSSLVTVWTGCSDGAVGTLSLQARAFRRRR